MTSQMISKWRKVMPRLFFSEVLHNITVLYRQDVLELAMSYFFCLYLDHFATIKLSKCSQRREKGY